jgi:hypothetical protein
VHHHQITIYFGYIDNETGSAVNRSRIQRAGGKEFPVNSLFFAEQGIPVQGIEKECEFSAKTMRIRE